jgi:hypothetical protein
MITSEQIIPLLLEACPSFQATWEEHLRQCDGPILYVALGDFARHLVELYQRHQTEAFPAVARIIERLHVEGDAEVREAATIGLLEGIQNSWSDSVDPELFLPYLLPESARWWRNLNNFWTGKSKSLGE